jgi:hypothetical protein
MMFKNKHDATPVALAPIEGRPHLHGRVLPYSLGAVPDHGLPSVASFLWQYPLTVPYEGDAP